VLLNGNSASRAWPWSSIACTSHTLSCSEGSPCSRGQTRRCYRSSPYHRGAQRSIGVVDAGHEVFGAQSGSMADGPVAALCCCTGYQICGPAGVRCWPAGMEAPARASAGRRVGGASGLRAALKPYRNCSPPAGPQPQLTSAVQEKPSWRSRSARSN
jgi:hypothetical protein